MSDALEAWRLRTDRPTRFEGPTPAAPINAAWQACAIGTQPEFEAWLSSRGLSPFDTGKGYVLNIPHGSARKLNAGPLTADGANTY